MCAEYRPDRLRFLGGDRFYVFFGQKWVALAAPSGQFLTFAEMEL